MDNQKKRFPSLRNTVFLSWVLCFLLVFLIPAAGSGIIYANAVAALRRDVDRVYRAELEKLYYLLDARMDELNRVAIDFSLNKDLVALCAADNFAPEQRMQLYELQKRLRDYCLVNSNIHEIAVVFDENDIVLTNTSSYSVQDYSEVVFSGSLARFYQAGSYTNEYYVTPIRGEETVIHVLSLPLGLDSAYNAFAFIVMERTTLVRLGAGLENCSLTLTVNEEPITIGREAETEAAHIITMASSVPGVNYTYTIDANEYSQNVTLITFITWLALAVCVVLCIVILVVFMRKNYNPILRIATRLGVGEAKKGFRNELAYIETSLQQTMDEAQRMKLELDKSSDAARDLLVSKLVLGSLYETDIEQASVTLPRFEGDTFLCVVARPVQYSEMFFTKDGNEKDNLYLAKYIIKNVVQDFTTAGVSVYTITIGGSVVTVLGCQAMGAGKLIQELERLPDTLQSMFNLGVFIGVGRAVPTVMQLHKSYTQATEALDYGMVFNRQFTHYAKGQENSVGYVQDTNHALEVNKKFLNTLVAMQFDAAIGYLDELFAIFFHPNQPIETLRAGIYSVVGIFCGALRECQARHPVPGLDVAQTEAELAACTAIYELKGKMVDILVGLSTVLADGKSKIMDDISGPVNQYISQNYHNRELGVAGIADHFGYSASHLSRIYKKATGENLLDALHKARIAQAKVLLHSSPKTIAQVARQVGYNDANAFIRTFKRYEGISPGKYSKT